MRPKVGDVAIVYVSQHTNRYQWCGQWVSEEHADWWLESTKDWRMSTVYGRPAYRVRIKSLKTSLG